MNRGKKAGKEDEEPLLDEGEELGEEEIPNAPLTNDPKPGFYEDHVSAIAELTGNRQKGRRAKSDQSEADTRFGRANELFLLGRFDEAIPVLQNLILDVPSMTSAYLTLALIFETRNDWYEAARIYIDAAEHSKKGEHYMRAAELYAKLNNVEKAIECCTGALKWTKSVEPLLRRAELCKKLEDWPNVAASLKQALDLDPKNLDVAAELAVVYDSRLRDSASSLKVLRIFYSQLVNQSEVGSTATPVAARAAVPQIWDYEATIIMYGQALLKAKDWIAIGPLVEFLDRKRGMRALPVEIAFLLVISKIRVHKLREATNTYNLLLRQPPSKFESHFVELALYLMEVQEWDEAIKVLFYVCSEVESPIVWFLMGQSYTKLEKYELAAERYRLCVNADPNNHQYALALAETYSALSNVEMGIKVLNEYQNKDRSRLLSSFNLPNSNQNPNSDSTMDITGLTTEMPIRAPTQLPISSFESTDAYSKVEAGYRITIQKAKLYFSKREYFAYVDILTPYFNDSSLLFYRKKRRVKSMTEVLRGHRLPLDEAKKKKGRKKAVPIETGPLTGISAFKPAPSVPEEEFHEDEFQMEADEELLDDEDDEFGGPEGSMRVPVATPGSKKRKRESVASHSSATDLIDLSGDNENTTFEILTRRWSKPSPARLSEMASRKNAWEIPGMLEFMKLIIDYCKCLSFLRLGSIDFYRILEVVFFLTSYETEFTTQPPEMRADLTFQVAQIAYSVGKFSEATQMIRSVCREFPADAHVWNFFFLSASRAREFFVSRMFTQRMVFKHAESLPLQLLSGHISQVARSYHSALSSYLQAYMLDNTFPITLLCTAVAYISRAMARTTPNRNAVVMKAFAFFYKYFIEHAYGAGGCKHEAYYNLARAYHHLSLFEYAIPLYKLVLSDTTVDYIHQEERAREGVVASLKREAAYNLAIIYRNSGSHHLARELLQAHLTF